MLSDAHGVPPAGTAIFIIVCRQGWESRTHPFKQVPLFQDLQKLPPTEMHSRLADPSVRAEMLAQAEALVMEDSLQGRMVKMMFSNMKFYYPIPQGECRNGRLGPLTVAATLTRPFLRTGDGWDYERTPDESVHAIAEREGRSPFEVSFDIMMENNGRGVIWRGSADVPAWYDDAKENLMHDNMVVSLSQTVQRGYRGYRNV